MKIEVKEKFEISRSSFWNKIYKRLRDYFDRKYSETQDLTIRPIYVKLPTPFCMIIRFSEATDKSIIKKELVLQGDWKDMYVELTNNPELEWPSGVDIELVIRHRIEESYEIN